MYNLYIWWYVEYVCIHVIYCKILRIIQPKPPMPKPLVCISIYSILLHLLHSWFSLTIYRSWQTIGLVQELPRHTYMTPPPFEKRVNDDATFLLWGHLIIMVRSYNAWSSFGCGPIRAWGSINWRYVLDSIDMGDCFGWIGCPLQTIRLCANACRDCVWPEPTMHEGFTESGVVKIPGHWRKWRETRVNTSAHPYRIKLCKY